MNLKYTCESQAVQVIATITSTFTIGDTVTVTDIDGDPVALTLYNFIRTINTYHTIVAVLDPTGNGLNNVATIYNAYSSAALLSAGMGGSEVVTDAEYGVFYSDPTVSI